jgi:hypothetical protein
MQIKYNYFKMVRGNAGYAENEKKLQIWLKIK